MTGQSGQQRTGAVIMPRQANPTDIEKFTKKGINVQLTEDDWMDPNDESDMAKSQLYKVGKYAAGLINMIKDGEQLDAWVQAKLTKAADYLGAVMHYMEGEKALGADRNINEYDPDEYDDEYDAEWEQEEDQRTIYMPYDDEGRPLGEGLGNEIMTLQAMLIKLNQNLAYEKREGGGKDLKQIAFLEDWIKDTKAKLKELKEKLAQQKQGNVKEITAYDYQQMQEPENLQGDQELSLKAKLRKLLPHLSNEPLDKVEAFLHKVRTNALEYDRMSSNDILSDYQVEYGSEEGMMQEDIEDTRVKPYLTVNPLDTQRAQELRDRYFLNQDIQIDPENETSPRNKFSSYDYDLIEKLRLVLGSNDVEITDHNLDLFPVKSLNEAKSTCCMKCGHMHVQGTKCPDPTYSKDSPKHCKNRKK
jgi:hypothetical protein